MPLGKNSPIGVFDSGVGGLTVIRELEQQMPRESYLYYADTAHVPYGARKPEEIRTFAYSITEFLVNKGAKMVIMACNTSTAFALRDLRKAFSIPVIGVIEPGVEEALKANLGDKIGILATEATVNSQEYQRTIRQKRDAVKIKAIPCPRLVPLIEEGILEGQVVEEAINCYLTELVQWGMNTLILGCTHYPFLLPLIKAALEPQVAIIDPAKETVAQGRRILEKAGLLKDSEDPFYHYFTSGDPDRFKDVAGRLLGKDINLIKE